MARYIQSDKHMPK